MSDIDAVDFPRKGHQYRHYKGNLYEVMVVAMDSETLNHRVIYFDVDRPHLVFDRKMSGPSEKTGKPCGWVDRLLDGRPRYTRVS